MNPDFDLKSAHRYFAAACFNQAWDFIEKPDRSPADDEQMIRLAHASLWHWSQREDCTDRNLSIGYWQAARIYALLGQAQNARRYAQLCLAASEELEPFYQGYAHEALARAELVAGDQAAAQAHLAQAQNLAELVEKPEDRKLLLDDLQSLGPTGSA